MNTMRSLLILALATPLSAFAESKINVREAAAKIDGMVEKNYTAHEVKPNPITKDAAFARRAYLEIIGRIPTAKEARDFLQSMEPKKRADLIDELLDSPGYVSHQFNFWADILRLTSRMPGQDASNGAMYAKWIKNAIAENMPYDEFVRSLVSAQGLIDENGAVGFYLRDRGMPLDHLATTVQTFLGTQLVCAQCHDHPFDDWTQMDYYKLAAFSHPMNVIRSPENVTKTIAMAQNKAREEGREFYKKRSQKKKQKISDDEISKADKKRQRAQNTARQVQRGLNALTQNFRNSVIGETNRALKLPHDYQYDDAKPNDVIYAATPFGDKVKVKKGESKVEAYANWMTSTTNPRFTKVIANRMWKRVMGVGLFEPVDNLRDDTEATNPELLAYLEKLIVDLDFDLKEYYRVLYNTKTWQREAEAFDMFAGEKFHYPGPRLERMSAEQVWDSMVSMMRPDVDTAKNPRFNNDPKTGRGSAWKRVKQLTPDELMKAQAKLTAFNKESEKTIEDFRARTTKIIESKNKKQALPLAKEIVKFNNDATRKYAELTFWDPESMSGYVRTPFRNVPRLLVQQLDRAFPKIDFPNVNRGYVSMKQKGERDRKKKVNEGDLRKRLGKEGYVEYKREQQSLSRMREYVRASELSSPAPDGHFLRTFGQSDRELIENANDAASVPQSLALMNSRIFAMLTDPYSVLSKEIHASEDDDELLDNVFLSMLSRKPTDRERSLLKAQLENEGNQAAKSVVWTVLNTQQFLFIQ